MAANTNPIYPVVPVSAVAQFVNADGTTIKAIYTPTLTNGARVDCIMVTNTDTIAYLAQLYLRKGGVNYLLGSATIPASAGNLGTVQPVNLLEAIGAASGGPAPFMTDPAGNKFLVLDAGTQLFVGMTVAVTAAKAVNFSTFAGEY